MIMIFSIHSDLSTNQVIDWLSHAGHPFARFNGVGFEQAHVTYQLTNAGERWVYDHETIPVNDVYAVWYRRDAPARPDMPALTGKGIEKKVRKHLAAELSACKKSLLHTFQNCSWLSSPQTVSPNKLHVLRNAIACGLQVPATFVTTAKNELLHFMKKYDRAITKPVYESDYFEYEGSSYWMYTAAATTKEVEDYPEHMFPVLVQENIEKEYELRIFYLDGKCHAMAMFSQLDSKTATDFRRYNFERPNRCVPYALPVPVQEKLHTLMQCLQLNTGSIDMIHATDGRYVFLEVNPVGQFGMVSQPCNYYLEKEVAAWLIQHDIP